MGRFDDDDALRSRANDPLFSAFVAAVKGTYETPPAEAVERAHIASIVEASASVSRGEIDSTTPRRVHVLRRKMISMSVRFVAAVFGISALSTGLAYTGVVTLPEPARDALQTVGIDVPDGDAANEQGTESGRSSADDVHAVIESTPPSARGCEFGQRVSAAASGKDKGTDHTPCDNGTPSPSASASARADDATDDHGRGDEMRNEHARDRSAGDDQGDEHANSNESRGDGHAGDRGADDH